MHPTARAAALALPAALALAAGGIAACGRATRHYPVTETARPFAEFNAAMGAIRPKGLDIKAYEATEVALG